MSLHRALVAFSAISILTLLGCSTPLLNFNTLEQGSTLTDLAISQIVFNLAKIKENAWFVPSQIQFTNGTITARTNLSPTYTNPAGAAIFNTTAIARAATTTTTSTAESMTPNPSVSVAATIEDMSNWSITPIQDPEALTRLQWLYQYGAGQMSALDLLCFYPIPEKPEEKQQKSDLQTLAEALATYAKTVEEKKSKDENDKEGIESNDKEGRNKADKNSKDNKDAKNEKPKKYYIRGENDHSCRNANIPLSIRYGAAPWMLVANNPDISFLQQPTCILCAWPNKDFARYLKKTVQSGGWRIYVDRTSDTTIKFDKNAQYIPVVLNDYLVPLGPEACDGDGRNWTSRLWKDGSPSRIDWLFVDPIGTELRPNAMQVGSWNGYMVSTTCPRNFAQFEIAIKEATLQSPQMEKVQASAPPLVQTTTGH
jgi:hypothetical protein